MNRKETCHLHTWPINLPYTGYSVPCCLFCMALKAKFGRQLSHKIGIHESKTSPRVKLPANEECCEGEIHFYCVNELRPGSFSSSTYITLTNTLQSSIFADNQRQSYLLLQNGHSHNLPKIKNTLKLISLGNTMRRQSISCIVIRGVIEF